MKKDMQALLIKLGGILAGVAAVLAIIIGVYHGAQVATPPVDNALGAVSGNEIQGNEFVVGGVHWWNYGASFAATSTSVCSFKTPNATTTWRTLAMGTRMPSATGSTIKRIIVSLAPNTFASTTLLTGIAVTTGTNAEFSATSSPTNVNWALHLQQQLIPPNTNINFATEGTSTNPGGMTGFCSASLIQF